MAIWFAILSIPTFLFVKDRKPDTKALLQNVKHTVKDFRTTAKELKAYPQIMRFLLARMVYNDGLVTIFAFGGIYAAGTLAFTFDEIMILGIVLNITAGIGAFLMGFLDDKVGGRLTIKVTLIGLMIAIVLAVYAPEFRSWLQYLLGGSALPEWVNGKNISLVSNIIYNVLESTRIIGLLLLPLLPNISSKIDSQLGLLGTFIKNVSNKYIFDADNKPSLIFDIDNHNEYWTITTGEGVYFKKLRNLKLEW